VRRTCSEAKLPFSSGEKTGVNGRRRVAGMQGQVNEYAEEDVKAFLDAHG
jgi:hypothetical protein